MRDFDQHNPAVRLAISIVLLVLVVGGVWGAAGLLWPEDDGKITILKANSAPYKTKPDQPGGMQIPHQDKLIFNTVSSDGKMVTVERILPGPEQPLNAIPNNMDIPTQITPVVHEAAAITQAQEAAKAQIAAQITPPAINQPAEPAKKVEDKAPALAVVPVAPVSVAPVPVAPVPVAMGRVVETNPKTENPKTDIGKPEATKTETVTAPSALPVKPAAAFDITKGDVTKVDAPVIKKVEPVVVPVKEAAKEKAKEEAPVADDQTDADNEPAATDGNKTHFQLASFFDRPTAEKGLAQFRSKFAGELQGAGLTIAQAKINGNKTVFRIQGSASSADATEICADIKAKGGSCVLIRP